MGLYDAIVFKHVVTTELTFGTQTGRSIWTEGNYVISDPQILTFDLTGGCKHNQSVAGANHRLCLPLFPGRQVERTPPKVRERETERQLFHLEGRLLCVYPPRTSLKEDYLYACCACVLCLDCKQGFSRSTVTRVSMETWDLIEGE